MLSRPLCCHKTNDSDCANFVSQCLYAGKLSMMTNTWYHRKMSGRMQISKAWGRANDLYKWLLTTHYVTKTYSSTSKSIVDDAGRFIYNYRSKKYCAAVIFFDFTNDGVIDHAALSGEVTQGTVPK